MASIEDQLTQLESDRQDLVSNLETKGISGLTGDETFTELVPEVLNISGGGGADLSDYFGTDFGAGQNGSYAGVLKLIKKLPNTITPSGNNLAYSFWNMMEIVEAPLFNTSSVTNMQRMFQGCASLETIPQYNTANVTNFESWCLNCVELKNLPILDMTSATNLQYMFYGCTKLTDDSINNILASLTSATSYTGTKTLAYLGFTTYIATSQEIQGLSNYQDFIDAGWTIGY